MSGQYKRLDNLKDVLDNLILTKPNPLILIMGDFHGCWYEALENYRRICQERGTRPDLLLQLGDFGYYPDSDIKYHLPYLDHQFNHPLVFIDGNHEDHEQLRPLAGKRVGADCYYAQRGLLWEGILFAGGAYSVDKPQRIARGMHWSPLEELTEQEALNIIDAHKTEKVHTIVSHTCPSVFDMAFAASPNFGGENKKEISRQSLNLLLQHFRPKTWFFGHWHKSSMGYGGYSKCRWRLIDMVRRSDKCDYHWTTLDDLKNPSIT
jgi:hypothetical protein